MESSDTYCQLTIADVTHGCIDDVTHSRHAFHGCIDDVTHSTRPCKTSLNTNAYAMFYVAAAMYAILDVTLQSTSGAICGKSFEKAGRTADAFALWRTSNKQSSLSLALSLSPNHAAIDTQRCRCRHVRELYARAHTRACTYAHLPLLYFSYLLAVFWVGGSPATICNIRRDLHRLRLCGRLFHFQIIGDK